MIWGNEKPKASETAQKRWFGRGTGEYHEYSSQQLLSQAQKNIEGARADIITAHSLIQQHQLQMLVKLQEMFWWKVVAWTAIGISLALCAALWINAHH